MKELLDLLDERVTALVGTVNTLRQENDQLRRELTGKTASLAEENQRLLNALTEERSIREAAAQRIDALLLRIPEQISE